MLKNRTIVLVYFITVIFLGLIISYTFFLKNKDHKIAEISNFFNQNFQKYLKISNLKMGLSMAASWAWGVSLAVSFSILETKGFIPFAIWGFCNVSALLVFGMFTLKYPAYLNWMDNRIAKLFMFIIQII